MRRAEAGIQVDKFYPPTDWLDNNNKQIDIRKNAENNSIVLLVGHSADFSNYSLLGVTADTSSGTYDVYIDDVLVGSGITKNTKYDIDFSTINTSYGSATTPESLVLHKIVIKPTISGQTITRFCCQRTTGATGIQQQGTLWAHFELTNPIRIDYAFTAESSWRNLNLYAVTAKNNIITVIATSGLTGLYSFAGFCSNVNFLPTFKYNNTTNEGGSYLSFNEVHNKRLSIKNNPQISMGIFRGFLGEKIETENSVRLASGTGNLVTASSMHNLKMLPKYVSLSSDNSLLMEGLREIYPTKINDSSNTSRAILRIGGTSTYPVRGFRGLKVSNEAPFSGTSPQIDVSYTGLDREELVELFNSLPAFMSLTVVGSPTINNGVVSGFSSSNYLQMANNLPSTDSFEIQVDFTTGNSFTSYETVFLLRSICDIEYNTGTNSFATYNWSNSSYQPIITNPQTNTRYIVRFIKENSNLDVYLSTNGSDFTKVRTTDVGTKAQDNPMSFGTSIVNLSRAFAGSINIPNCYIKLNGTKYTFLLPSATTRTLKCDGATGNNLTKVGSPTIDENGVASGFSGSNSFRIPNVSVVDMPFEIFIDFTTGADITSVNQTLLIERTSNNMRVWKLGSESYFKFNFLDNISNSVKILKFTYQVNISTHYKWKISYKNKVLKMFLYDDNNQLLDSVEMENVSPKISGYIAVGSIETTSGYWSGTINLPNMYFKAGDNFIVKGYLTDTDKNIALNKGWALTLS